MNVVTTNAGGAQPSRGEPVAGLRTLLAKDVRDWVSTRRAPVTVLAATILLTIGTVGSRIAVLADPHGTNSVVLDPVSNLVGAGWSSLLPLFAVFATIGLITGERQSGTLAWSLSMPLGRPAFVLSKAISSVGALSILTVAIPLCVTSVAAAIVYGPGLDGGTVAMLALALPPLVAFYALLSIALGVFLPSQGSVAGVAIAVTFLPRFATLISRDLPGYLPTSIDAWVMAVWRGQQASSVAPILWLASVVVLVAIACRRLERAEI